MTISSTQFKAMYATNKPFIKPTDKPFVKWAGGKRGLLEILLSSMPRQFNSYFEPFLGGGALFFYLASVGILQGKRVY